MLQGALKVYTALMHALPSPCSPGWDMPRDLGPAVETLKLELPPGEIRGKAISAGAFTGIVAILPSLLLFDIAFFAIGVFLSAATTMSLLYVPVALYRIRKARVTSDATAFLLGFTTYLRHMNQEEAYSRSIQGLCEEFKAPWLMLRLGELASVSECLSKLAADLRPCSHQLYSVFMDAASVVQEEEPDYRAMLRDSLSAMQLENSIELGRFAERFRGAIAMVSFAPLALYIALPFASAFTGYSVDLAFFAASLGVLAASTTAFLYLLAHYPSSASFADLGSVDEELAAVTGVTPRTISYKWLAIPGGALLPLSILHPGFLLVLGACLIFFAIKNRMVMDYLEFMREELASLPLGLKELTRRLARGEPLDAVLGCSESFAMRAIGQRSTARLLPERVFILVEDAVHHLGHAGDALSGTLEELRIFIRELLNYRSVMSARMESSRASMFLLYILLPVLSLFSLWAFNFIAEVSTLGGEATPYQEYAGISIISQPPRVELVLGFMSPALILSMALFTLLAAICEDIVAPQLLKAKTTMLGVGALILGSGGAVLVQQA